MDDPCLRGRERYRWGRGGGWKGWCSIDFSASLSPAGLSFISPSPVREPPLITLGDSLSSPSSFPLQSYSHMVVFVNHLWITNCSLCYWFVLFLPAGDKVSATLFFYFMCVICCMFQTRAREALDHLLFLFSVLAGPLPFDRLQSLVTLLSSQPQQPSPSSLLILNLLVGFAVFFQQSLNKSTEILQTVRQLCFLLKNLCHGETVMHHDLLYILCCWL